MARWALARSLAAIAAAFLPAATAATVPEKSKGTPRAVAMGRTDRLPSDYVSRGHSAGTRQRQRRKLERRGGLARRKAPRR